MISLLWLLLLVECAPILSLSDAFGKREGVVVKLHGSGKLAGQGSPVVAPNGAVVALRRFQEMRLCCALFSAPQHGYWPRGDLK